MGDRTPNQPPDPSINCFLNLFLPITPPEDGPYDRKLMTSSYLLLLWLLQLFTYIDTKYIIIILLIHVYESSIKIHIQDDMVKAVANQIWEKFSRNMYYTITQQWLRMYVTLV